MPLKKNTRERSALFKFLMNILHAPRRQLGKRTKISVVNQVFQFHFGEHENKEIVRGWLHIANCLNVNPDKLRAVDSLEFLASLDWTGGDMTASLQPLLAQQPGAAAAADITLIELSKIVGQAKGGAVA